MLLAKRPHTVGNRRRYTIDYSEWLDEGVTLASTAVTSSSTTATIDGAVVQGGNQIVFFVNGGVLSELFTVSIQVVDSKTGIKNDTMDFFVVAP